MATTLTPAIPVRALGASHSDLDAELGSVLLFVVRYAEAEAVLAMERALASARGLGGDARRAAVEKALYDGASHAVVAAPNEAADEVWPIVERIDPYGDPELKDLSPLGEDALDRLAEDRAAGRLGEGGFGDA